ncbi:hypothetical protein K1719_025630 [Acacia pycnantha]|nr:hypothetical protein K1719_025630 [Acacia pycnantha]
MAPASESSAKPRRGPELHFGSRFIIILNARTEDEIDSSSLPPYPPVTSTLEASSRQMEVIKETMRRFCVVSGHKINLNKSKALFSRNVHFNREIALSNKSGIGVTTDLGKYLGVPLIHFRVTKETFGHIIQKVKSRLSSWKGKYLTMAGRAVLIKSVISVLPSYQMQSSILPKGVIQEIKKISRSFLWCQDENAKKMHLIAWQKILRSRKVGG